MTKKEPSRTALEIAETIIARGFAPDTIALLIDEYAAHSIEAERARIVAHLEKGHQSLLQKTHQQRRKPREAAWTESLASGIELAIAIVKGGDA